MNWLRRLRDWRRELCDACGEPWPDWEDDYPDSTPPGFVDSDQFRFLPEIPKGMPSSDTKPTDPDALATLQGKLN